MIGSDRPRLVAVDSLAITTALDPYMGLRALASYSGCSIRWLRDRLTDLSHPLPAYRLPGGKILVRRSEFDGWLARYRQVGDADVNRVVSEALRGISSAPRFSP